MGTRLYASWPAREVEQACWMGMLMPSRYVLMSTLTPELHLQGEEFNDGETPETISSIPSSQTLPLPHTPLTTPTRTSILR